MSGLLDKTITISVRQVWRWTRRILYLLIPIYLILIFATGWNVRMGGVSLKRSPFADRVPADCVGYADRIGQTNHYSLNSRSLLFDVLNFRGRVSEGTIDTLLDGRDYAIKCFGYAILNGLHGDAAGVANFTERWVDKEGRPVVSVSVQYHQTLKDIGFNNHGEASK